MLTSKYASYSATIYSDRGLFWQYTTYMCNRRSCESKKHSSLVRHWPPFRLAIKSWQKVAMMFCLVFLIFSLIKGLVVC